jgi:hypothetical protein
VRPSQTIPAQNRPDGWSPDIPAVPPAHEATERDARKDGWSPELPAVPPARDVVLPAVSKQPPEPRDLRRADRSEDDGADTVDCGPVSREMRHAGRDVGDTGDERKRVADGLASHHSVVLASWQAIKSRFVDDPSGALAEAEDLVRQTVEARVRALNDEAAALCARDRDDASTEDLRTRLIRYQAYCDRLISDSAAPG